MPNDSPPPARRNSSAELARKHIQAGTPSRPHWSQITLTDQSAAVCAVLDHYNGLHWADRGRILELFRQTERHLLEAMHEQAVEITALQAELAQLRREVRGMLDRLPARRGDGE